MTVHAMASFDSVFVTKLYGNNYIIVVMDRNIFQDGLIITPTDRNSDYLEKAFLDLQMTAFHDSLGNISIAECTERFESNFVSDYAGLVLVVNGTTVDHALAPRPIYDWSQPLLGTSY